MRVDHRAVEQAGIDLRADSRPEPRADSDLVGELVHMDGEFEVDQPAIDELDVEDPARRLVAAALSVMP